jgi:two-component system response regulator
MSNSGRKWVNGGPILLVEDNPDDILLTLRALRKNNIANEMIVMHDGAAALDYLFAAGDLAAQTRHVKPAIILLDLKLPKVSGLDVLRQLRANARTRLLPVVVLTSSDEEQDIIDSYRLGANSYIRKPVDFDQFVGAVQHLGLYWLSLNILPPDPQGG